MNVTNMNPTIRNYRFLLKAVPGLSSVVEVLNKHHIKYGIYSGSYVYIATASRIPTDVDVLVADADIPKVKALFSDCECLEQECCLYLYPGRERKIEIVSRSVIHIGGAQYHFKLTELAWQHTREIQADGCRVRLCNPVDTILLKAILQRDIAEGKHDFSDIEALLQNEAIDHGYLEERIKEFGFNERLNLVLQKYHLREALV